MENSKKLYINLFPGRIKLLQDCLADFGTGRNKDKSKETIKNIAKFFRCSSSVYAFSELMEDAADLEICSEDDIQLKTLELINALNHIIESEKDNKLQILIVEDNKFFSIPLNKKLEAPNRNIHIAETGSEAIKKIQETEFSLVILDLGLPDINGVEILQYVRQNLKTRILPVIILTANTDDQSKIDSFSSGADEYLDKTLDFNTIATAISSKLERMAELFTMSFIDTVTCLPNQAAFIEAYNKMSLLSLRHGKSFCLCIIKTHSFTAFSLYKFSVKNEILHQIADRMKTVFRKSDIISRVSDDDFIILLPYTPIEGALGVIKKSIRVLTEDGFKIDEVQTLNLIFNASILTIKEYMPLNNAIEKLYNLFEPEEDYTNRIFYEETPETNAITKVLLVEEDKIVTSVIENLLEKEGYDVLSFNDGNEAFLQSPDTGISLAIISNDLPGMTGTELLQKLRNKPNYSRLPIVILNSTDNYKEIVRGFDIGADDYIVKPFSPIELIARVKNLLRKSNE